MPLMGNKTENFSPRLLSDNPPERVVYWVRWDKDNAWFALAAAILCVLAPFMPLGDLFSGRSFVIDPEFPTRRLPFLIASIPLFLISYLKWRKAEKSNKKWNTVFYSFTFTHTCGPIICAVDVQIELPECQADPEIYTALKECAETSACNVLSLCNSIPSREILLQAIIPPMATKQREVRLDILNVEIIGIREATTLDERMKPLGIGAVSTMPEQQF